jgi:D-alanyl-lipoteichoic acid acyltransferase DltB (MBOAT superfamily)
MLFNSYQFLVFFPIVVTAFFALPHRYRWLLLLAASYVFYMAWNPLYILLLLGSTLVDYVAGIQISIVRTAWWRRLWLLSSISANLGILFTFKYLDFFSAAAASMAQALGLPYMVPHLDVLLPVGISFYTFQTMSYTIDVYRGVQTVERHLGYFALYVAYFPQLVAGPIERSGRLLPQLRARHDFEYVRVREGLLQMGWGMFKKVVIADQLAAVANAVYANPHACYGPILVLGTLAFAFQIYCDFSGYSDIAIGAARVMGVDLMRNFNRPYRAASFAEFWKRWHISLSTWFRDYVYIPLGGNRTGAGPWLASVTVVFLVSGLWHGANWTFIAWGAVHAAFYLGEALLAKVTPRSVRESPVVRRVRPVVVFAGVCFAWIFFRAASISDAMWVINHLSLGWENVLYVSDAMALVRRLDYPVSYVTVEIVAVVWLLWAEGKSPGTSIVERLPLRPAWQRWLAYVLLGWATLNLGVVDEQPFLYFQF